jgi:hypothetical protein
MLKRKAMNTIKILVVVMIFVLAALAVQPVMAVLRGITVTVSGAQLLGIVTLVMIAVDTLIETISNN